MRLLVTGGLGFIGSNFVRLVLAERESFSICNLDRVTYAGNPANLADVAGHARYRFVRGDICDREKVRATVEDFAPDAIINFAAESHVDRSIMNPDDFVQTNFAGVSVLLSLARERGCLFFQVSTDEVYGSVREGSSKETDPARPRNPYAACKAGADLLALSCFTTYGQPVVISRASNTFGPYQYPEKFLSLSITNLLEGQPIPLYGDGKNVREWLFVEDHCRGLLAILEKGEHGEIYNVGGGREMPNLELAGRLVHLMGKTKEEIHFVKDRPGHDFRYSLDTAKLRALGWKPIHGFDVALERTVQWYREREDWWRPIRSGQWKDYYRQAYLER
jgi:dTDP-glucose 4,6-dehydratase